MLIRHERYVGFRCPECGRTNIKKLSIFDFSGNKSVTLGCHCNASYVRRAGAITGFPLHAPPVSNCILFRSKRQPFGAKKYSVSIARLPCWAPFVSGNMMKSSVCCMSLRRK